MSRTEQYQFMKYEDCEDGKVYAVTLNPVDAHQYWENDDRCLSFYKYHKQYLTKCTFVTSPCLTNVCTFILKMEVSPKGRLHFHGMLKILDKKMFYLHILHRLQKIYSYEIDTIKDPEVWDKYVMKQQPFYDTLSVGNDFKRMRKDFYTQNKLDEID